MDPDRETGFISFVSCDRHRGIVSVQNLLLLIRIGDAFVQHSFLKSLDCIEFLFGCPLTDHLLASRVDKCEDISFDCIGKRFPVDRDSVFVPGSGRLQSQDSPVLCKV